MPPHLSPSNDANPLSTYEMFGLSLRMPEPEVARANITKSNAKALAALICDLIDQHETLLEADCDGATVTIRERGPGGAVMRFTIEANR